MRKIWNILFMIMHTDRDNKKSTMYSLVESSKFHTCRNIFLFDSFGFIGFKEFIIYNDRKIIDKLIYGLKK